MCYLTTNDVKTIAIGHLDVLSSGTPIFNLKSVPMSSGLFSSPKEVVNVLFNICV